MDKITRQCPQTTTFLKRKESRSGIEPRSLRLPAKRHTARPKPAIEQVSFDTLVSVATFKGSSEKKGCPSTVTCSYLPYLFCHMMRRLSVVL